MKRFFTLAATMLLAIGAFAQDAAETCKNQHSPVDYIYFDGPCERGTYRFYYQTGHYPTANTVVDLTFKLYEKSNGRWTGIFAGRDHYNCGMSFYQNDNWPDGKPHFGYFVSTNRNDAVESHTIEYGKLYTANFTKDALTVNGEVIDTKEGITEANFAASETPITLFSSRQDYPMYGEISYFKISEGEEVVRELVPVMRHDGVPCFYDKVKEEYLTPNVDGVFFAGLNEGSEYGYITAAEDNTVFVGQTCAVVPNFVNLAAADYTVAYASSNEAVVTVADGVAKGVGAGEAVVSATVTKGEEVWVVTTAVTVFPSTVVADQFTEWNGTDDAVLPAIRYSGDEAKWAYTIDYNSGHDMGWTESDPNYNVVVGVPVDDAAGKAWYAADYELTNDATSAWTYNNTTLPNGWSSNTGDVYVRRYFKAEGDLTGKAVVLAAPHDDAPSEYYINGVLVWAVTDGWNEGELVMLSDEAKALIKTDGSINVLAYHVHQNWGGRYADGGLYIGGTTMTNEFKRILSAVAQLKAEGKEVTLPTFTQNQANSYYNFIVDDARLAANRVDYSKIASAEPADGMPCWLYNVGAGKFLAGGNDWGTRYTLTSQISAWPMILHENTSGENRYTIQSNLPNGERGWYDGMGHNGYVDCAGWNTTDEGWAWEFQYAGDGTYRIINCDNQGENIYLGMARGAHLRVDVDKAGAENPDNLWKIISKAQLEALYENASAENVADVTYKIRQNGFCQNDFEGNDKGAANNNFNDSKWETNVFTVNGWKNNNNDGDNVAEAYSKTGDIYLKQTVEGLLPGKYLVSCQGFYRAGNYNQAMGGADARNAYLYAGTEENKVALPSILDGMNKAYGYGNQNNPDKLIPDNCTDAAHFFQFGLYKTEALQVEVGEDGKLELGVMRTAGDGLRYDWICVDNFRLECIESAESPVASKLYLRNGINWDGIEMATAADSEAFNRHFTWTGYLPSNSYNGYCFNFTFEQGHNGDECWGPDTQDTAAPAGVVVENFGNYGDKVYNYFGQSGYVTIHAYLNEEGGKIKVEDMTLKALKNTENLYIVGENTTGWSRESSVCPALPRVAPGVYEGVVTLKRDNAQLDAIRIATIADNGDNDSFVGFIDETILGNGTYKLMTGKASRCYMRKGDVKITVNFNEGTVKTEYIDVEPTYMYAVGTLAHCMWEPNNQSAYQLIEVKPFVFQGLVEVVDANDDGGSRFSLYEERDENLTWDHTGRHGPYEDKAAPELGVEMYGVATGQDRAWSVPVGEWFVTLNLNDNTFTYEKPAALLYEADGVVGSGADIERYMPFFNTAVKVQAYDNNTIVVKGWDGTEGSDLKVYYTTLQTLEEGDETEARTVIVGLEQLVNGRVISEYREDDEDPDMSYVYMEPQSEVYPACGIYVANEMTGIKLDVNEEGEAIGQISLFGLWMKAAGIGGEDDNMGVDDPIEAAYIVSWPGKPLTVGIANAVANDGKTVIYNIAGQKVNKTAKGIYIVNGKKVVVK